MINEGMNPYYRMASEYARKPQEMPFSAYVEQHMLTGFVFSTPEFFIMGRPVMSNGYTEDIGNPWHIYDEKKCDCWYVHAMSGDLSKAFDIMPWNLEWLAFERVRGGKRDMVICKLANMRRLATKVKLTSF